MSEVNDHDDFFEVEDYELNGKIIDPNPQFGWRHYLSMFTGFWFVYISILLTIFLTREGIL